MVDLLLHAALDAFDALIGAITLDDSIAVPIELDSMPDSDDDMVDVAIVADGVIEGSAIEIEGTSNAPISIEPNLGIGIGRTLPTEAITSIIPDTAVDATDAAIASGGGEKPVAGT